MWDFRYLDRVNESCNTLATLLHNQVNRAKNMPDRRPKCYNSHFEQWQVGSFVGVTNVGASEKKDWRGHWSRVWEEAIAPLYCKAEGWCSDVGYSRVVELN